MPAEEPVPKSSNDPFLITIPKEITYVISSLKFYGKEIMKIAVVGAGFCGLASCYYLADKATVVLFDKKAIGAGASGIIAGLLHPYAGPKASLSWMGHEAFLESRSLIETVAKEHAKRGIFRPEVAGMDFSQSKNHPEAVWWEQGAAQKMLPELLALPGLFIPNGLTVHCPGYLECLWQACQKKGVTFQQAAVCHPNELAGFDLIIFTVGASLSQLQEVDYPPIRLIKGQSIELDWQGTLPFAVNAGVQLSQVQQGSIWVGATYERSYATEAEDPQCIEALRKKVALFSPTLSTLPVKRIWTSLRATTKEKLPFLNFTPPNIYTLGGMGSKGLLYHAFMAKTLISKIIT